MYGTITVGRNLRGFPGRAKRIFSKLLLDDGKIGVEVGVVVEVVELKINLLSMTS